MISLRCEIKIGWMDAGKGGFYHGKFNCYDRIWAIVVWDNEYEPEFFKIAKK